MGLVKVGGGRWRYISGGWGWMDIFYGWMGVGGTIVFGRFIGGWG